MELLYAFVLCGIVIKTVNFFTPSPKTIIKELYKNSSKEALQKYLNKRRINKDG